MIIFDIDDEVATEEMKQAFLDSNQTVEEVAELEKLENDDAIVIGKWGRMFSYFMEEKHLARKTFLVMEGIWLDTIMEVQKDAEEMAITLENEYLKNYKRPTEQYIKILQYELEKRTYIEEIILKEIIYKAR